MAPIERDVKNQQPILPGKPWATLKGKTTKAMGGGGGGDGRVWNKTKNPHQALPISGNDKQEKRIGENNGGRLLRYPKGL